MLDCMGYQTERNPPPIQTRHFISATMQNGLPSPRGRILMTGVEVEHQLMGVLERSMADGQKCLVEWGTKLVKKNWR